MYAQYNALRKGLILCVSTFLLVSPIRSRSDDSREIPEHLSLKQAFEIALRSNKEIRASILHERSLQHLITSAEGAFDPSVYVAGEWAEEDSPENAVPRTADQFSEASLLGGIYGRLATGTELHLYTDVSRSKDHTGMVALDPEYADSVNLSITQDLLRDFGVTVNRAGITIAQADWKIAKEGIRDTVISSLLDLEQAYWALFSASEDLRVRKEQHARATRLVEVAESQVRVGEAAPIEITRARASAASQAVAIVDAENQITVRTNQLLRLLGILVPENLTKVIVLSDEPEAGLIEIDLASSMEIAFSTRPDCRQAALAMDRAETQELSARNQCLPRLTLYGGIRLEGLDDDIDESQAQLRTNDYGSWHAGIRLEVPVGNRVAQGNYLSAKYESRRIRTRQLAVLETAVREVGDAYDDLRTAVHRIESSRQSQVLAQELLDAEEKSFRLGRSSSLDVLDAQQALASAEREEIRARVNYATAMSYLYAVRGDFMERKGLSLPTE